MIPADKTCNVTADATVDTIELQADGNDFGTLNVQAGVTLTLENDDDNVSGQGVGGQSLTQPTPDHSIVDGVLRLEEDASTGAVLKLTTEPHRFDGDGRVVGEDELCEVQISADITFTNNLAASNQGVRGSMTIKGLTGGTTDGMFLNLGKVVATGSIVLHADTVIDDLTGAEWGVGLCAARITFERAATGLDGDFIHGIESGNHGVFKFESDVETCGTYKRFSCRGSFAFDNGAEFRYAAYETNAPPFDCPNPCETCPGTPVCVSDPFIRETDLNLTCP